jgi:hypothetical protein
MPKFDVAIIANINPPADESSLFPQAFIGYDEAAREPIMAVAHGIEPTPGWIFLNAVMTRDINENHAILFARTEPLVLPACEYPMCTSYLSFILKQVSFLRLATGHQPPILGF